MPAAAEHISRLQSGSVSAGKEEDGVARLPPARPAWRDSRVTLRHRLAPRCGEKACREACPAEQLTVANEKGFAEQYVEAAKQRAAAVMAAAAEWAEVIEAEGMQLFLAAQVAAKVGTLEALEATTGQVEVRVLTELREISCKIEAEKDEVPQMALETPTNESSVDDIR